MVCPWAQKGGNGGIEWGAMPPIHNPPGREGDFLRAKERRRGKRKGEERCGKNEEEEEQ